MYKRKKMESVWFLVTVLNLICVTHARDLYITIDGSDNDNICTSQDKPCATVLHAVSLAHSGDVINIDGNSPGEYSLEGVNITVALTLKSWIKNGASLSCLSPQPTTKCDTRFNSTAVTLIDVDIISCKICVTDSLLVVNRTKFFSAELLFQVHNNVTALISGSMFQAGSIHLGCDETENPVGLCQNNSLELDIKQSRFFGPGFEMKTYGSVHNVVLEFSGLLMDNFTDGPLFSHFTHMYFIMVDSQVQNWNSEKGISFSALPKSELNVFFRNNTFTFNSISKGGVIYLYTDSPSSFNAMIHDIDFEHNTAAMAGTCICLELDPEEPLQIVDIDQSNFENNTNSESAAAISTTGGYLRIHNSNFTSNHVTTLTSHEGSISEKKGAGGAINFMETAKVSLDQCRFVNNTANWFGGSIAGTGNIEMRQTYFENTDSHVHATVGDILFLTGDIHVSDITMKVVTTEMNLALLWYSSLYQLRSPDDSYFNLTCPQGSQFRNESLPVINASDSSIAYNDLFFYCDPCIDGTYSLQQGYRSGPLDWFKGNWSETFECQPCSFGGDCKGGIIRSKVNFWGFKDNNKDDSIAFISCPDGYCCEEEVCNSYNTCGANRTGMICGQCEDGMSEVLFSTVCVDNSQCTDTWYIAVDIILSFIYLLFFLYQVEITAFIMKYLFWQDNTQADDASGAGYVKSIFYFYQTIDLLNVQENQASTQIGYALRPFLTYLLSFKPIVAIWGACPFPGLNHVTKTILDTAQTFYMFIILGIMLIVNVILEAVAKHRRGTASINHSNSWRSFLSNSESSNTSNREFNLSAHTHFRARLATACVSLFLYNYISISNMCFLLLACVPIQGHSVLYYNGNVECFQSWQYVFIFLVIIHVIPFFAVVIISRSLLEKRFITNTDFILAYFLPFPALCYWIYLYIRVKVRSRSPSRNSEPDDYMQMMGESWDNDKEHIKEEILFIVEEPFINHKQMEKSAKYWEGIMIFRRLVLSILAAFIVDTMFGMTLQTISCLLFLLWHLRKQPFGARSSNILETISLTCLTIIAISHLIQATFWSAGKRPEGPSQLQIYVTDWIELVVVYALPLLLVVLLVISIVIRLGYMLCWGLHNLYRVTCGKWCRRGST